MNAMKQALTSFWSERNQRERTMLVAALAVIAMGLFYLLLIDPAITGRRDLEKRLPVLRQQAAEVRALSKEATTLSGAASAAPPAMTRETLEASLTRKGLKAQNVSLTGELAKVQLNSVSFAGVLEWLDEMHRTARVSVQDASVEALPQPDTVNATFTLRQQRSDQTQ